MSCVCPDNVSSHMIQSDPMPDVSACKCSSIYQNHDTMLQSSPSRSHHLDICIQMNELRMNDITSVG